MKARVVFFLLFLLPIPIHVSTDPKAGVIDFGRIDVPFRTNFTITIVLPASTTYIKTDSQRIQAPSRLTGNPGDEVNVSIVLDIPSSANPGDYILHIFISAGPTGSVEAQVAYQVRFSIKGIRIAAFSVFSSYIFLAVYNSYPEESNIVAEIYLDGSLYKRLQDRVASRAYGVRNVTGEFEGYHNVTVLAYSDIGYETKREFLGDVLPFDIKVSPKAIVKENNVLVSVYIKNYGRDLTLSLEAHGRSNEGEDFSSQSIYIPSGSSVNITITLRLRPPAFVELKIVSIKVFFYHFRIPAEEENVIIQALPIKKILIFAPIVAGAIAIARLVKPKKKFKLKRLVVRGYAGIILAIRERELIYPPSQVTAFITLPPADFYGDAVIISEEITAIRSTESLKVYVIGLGDERRALEIARSVRRIVSKKSEIVTEINPEDPIIDEILGSL